jgi:hypothetical protein
VRTRFLKGPVRPEQFREQSALNQETSGRSGGVVGLFGSEVGLPEQGNRHRRGHKEREDRTANVPDALELRPERHDRQPDDEVGPNNQIFARTSLKLIAHLWNVFGSINLSGMLVLINLI